MPASVAPPTAVELKTALASAHGLWSGIVLAAGEMFAPLDTRWTTSKSAFGRTCLLQHKKRTLLYLTPDIDKVWVAIVLGARAHEAAMASALPARIKKLLSEATPYAEGRGIRFPVSSVGHIRIVTTLLGIKTAPK
jgi:hypothetical protein